MTVDDALLVARDWARENGAGRIGFVGAFAYGSAARLAPGDTLPPTSDLDLLMVWEPIPENPGAKGKFRHQGVLLEVSHEAASVILDSATVLDHYQIAPSVASATVLVDSSGRIELARASVAASFADPERVRARCRHAETNARNALESVADAARPWPDRVTAWLFGNGIATHVLLVAGLRDPTVRKRYDSVRELLLETGQASRHDELLADLGCANWSPETASRHLDSLERAFDHAARVVQTPYRFAADMTVGARPVAIDGSRELIARGKHREAVFWIVAVFARSLSVLLADAAPAERASHETAFAALLSDLGIRSETDLIRRANETRARLPEIARVAEELRSAVNKD